MPPNDHKALVSATPGLEEVLSAELSELGHRGRVVPAGVELDLSTKVLLHVLIHTRIGARVTVRLASSTKVRNLETLAKLVRGLPWKDYVVAGQEVQVRATLKGAALRHRDTAQRKVQLAIVDALRGPRLPGRRPPREPLLVVLRGDGDRFTISVDASGELLHRRGWRKATAKAPLRENLAAATLRLAGWTPGMALVDPMCGSGTFAIEAAQWVAGIAPGARRDFAVQHWPSMDRRLYTSALSQARQARATRISAPILSADRDPGAVQATRSNASRAGVQRLVRVVHSPFAELEPPAGEPGLIVINPPWGQRLKGSDKAAVFAHIGQVARARWTGWRLAVLLPDARLRAKVDRRLEEVADFKSGGVRLKLVAGQV